MEHSSTNLTKYQTKNGLKQSCINNFQKKLVEIIKSNSPKTILDVGCGEAFNSEIILKNIDTQITGIDLDEGAIEMAKKRVPDATFQTGSIFELPFEDNSYDLVLCNEVLEHISNPHIAVKELLRVSKGTVIISVPHEPWFRLGNILSFTHITRFGNPIDHINHWSLSKFKKEFKEHLNFKSTKLAFPWIIVEATQPQQIKKG
jgi:ubiquinone/menaquinone biosynthesis C-methylase UbiE